MLAVSSESTIALPCSTVVVPHCEIDLTEHAQRPTMNSLGSAQSPPILGVSRLRGDVTHPAGHLCRIIPDRRGQFGQQIHGHTVDHRRWS